MPEIPLLFLKIKVEVSYIVRRGGRHPFAGRRSFAKAEMERQRERERKRKRAGCYTAERVDLPDFLPSLRLYHWRTCLGGEGRGGSQVRYVR